MTEFNDKQPNIGIPFPCFPIPKVPTFYEEPCRFES